MHVLHLYAGNLFGGIERMLLALWRGRRACGDAMRHHFALCFDGKLAEDLRGEGAAVTIIGPLHATRFWQVHRGTIVRCDAIDTVLRDEAGKLTLTLRGHPDRLPVSRMYAHLFKAM